MTITTDHTVSTVSTASTNASPEMTAMVRDAVAEIWAELLDIDEIEADDDFFALGGHSLLAIKVRARIDRRFEVAVDLADLFEYSTLTEVTDLVVTELRTRVP